MKCILLFIYALIVIMPVFLCNVTTKVTSLIVNSNDYHNPVTKETGDVNSPQSIAPHGLSVRPGGIDSIKIAYWYVNELTLLINYHGQGYAFFKRHYNENNDTTLLPEKLCLQILDLVNLIFIQKEKPVIESRAWHAEMVSTDVCPIIIIKMYMGNNCYERVIEYLTRIDHYDYKYSSDFTRLANIISNIENKVTEKEEK